MRSRSLARVVIASLGVSVVITPGCGKSPTTPTPSTTALSSTVKVEFGGRVVNADAGGPVEGVRVSLYSWSGPGGPIVAKDTATSGGDGTFTLALNLPMGWSGVDLALSAPPGYDGMFQQFDPTTAADRPEIRMYPTLVISPGESVEVRVDTNIKLCRSEYSSNAVACRRVLVTASPGDPVELEVVPDDSSKPMALSLDDWFLEAADMSVRRLMVPPGGAYVLGAGTARLTARR
jgi:hypothetical protein